VADRDRRPHDHAAAGRDAVEAGLVHLAAAWAIMTDIVDETGHSVGRGKGGILVIKRPWPSMIRTIWGDPERYRRAITPRTSRASTTSRRRRDRDEEGYYRIMGRIDDVLNVSGHRLGTMEIESALVANSKLVAEAAVVGRPTTSPARRCARSWC
jgi:acetyl-CoA synthetase